MYLNRSAILKRALIAVGASAACIASAVFLRGWKGNSLREGITLMLGYEWRAAVEHLLAAIGVPLGVGVSSLGLLLTFCWASYVVCKWVGWTWKPLARHPSEIASFERLAFLVGILSVVYVLSAAIWEWNQAYVGVYGGAPRGYMQWKQLGFDLYGAFMAFCVAHWTSKPRR